MIITITCFDTEKGKWIMPDRSGQMSSSMPIDEAFEKESGHPKELHYMSGERYKFFVEIKG